MPARLVLDKLDLNLSPLTATFLVIVVIILTGHGSSVVALLTTGVATIASKVITRRWLVETGGRVSDIGHCQDRLDKDF